MPPADIVVCVHHWPSASYEQRYWLRVYVQVPACGDNYSMNTMLRGQFNFTGTVVTTLTHTTTTLHSFARLVEVLPRQAQAMHSQPRDAIDTTVPKQAQSVCMYAYDIVCVGVCGYFSDRSLTAVRLATGRFPPTSRRITTEIQSTRRPWACGQDAISTAAPSTLDTYRYLRGCGASTQEEPFFSRFFVHYFRWHTINDDFNLPRQARDNTAVAAGV